MKKIIILFLLNTLVFSMLAQNNFSETLKTYCQTLPSEFAKITDDRKKILKQIGDYIITQEQNKQKSQLTVICTHNSRRSQFGQVWLKIAAIYYSLSSENIQTFSGGTEATACNIRTINALQRAGINVKAVEELGTPVTIANNPRYEVITKVAVPFYLFSKKYDDSQNPQHNFCAILVCSQADEACPVVKGATKRIALPFEDPKKSDNLPTEIQSYDASCREIAREMFYVMAYVQKKNP